MQLHSITGNINLILLPQVSVLSRACSDFLIQTMDLRNCLSLLSLAEAYGSTSLLQSANQFVIENFQRLSETQDFLEMQVLVVSNVLKSSSDIFDSKLKAHFR